MRALLGLRSGRYAFRRRFQPHFSSVAAKALTESEEATLHAHTKSLALSQPHLARVLLEELEKPSLDVASVRGVLSGHADEQKHPEHSRSTLNKVSDAKLMRGTGRGKTMAFAYLSPPDKVRVLKLANLEEATEVAARGTGKTSFFASLPGEVKYKALMAWQRERVEDKDSNLSHSEEPPSRGQLLKLSVLVGLPLVGFGFVDNFLMISFGDAIEHNFGMVFGISTMMAAGLGNLCSNLAGLGAADHIENVFAKHVPQPNLSSAQQRMRVVRITTGVGAVCGMTIGCLLGLVPLAWTHAPHAQEEATGAAEQ